MELRPTEMQELPEHWEPLVAFGMPIPIKLSTIGRRTSKEPTQVLAGRIPKSNSPRPRPERIAVDYRLRLSEDFWVGVRNG